MSRCRSSYVVLVMMWLLFGRNYLQDIDALDLLASQSKVGSELTIESGEEEAGSDIREESNGGLGHRKDGVLCCDAEWRVNRQTNTTSHGDAVHEGHIRLGICGDQVVELVFQCKVVL